MDRRLILVLFLLGLLSPIVLRLFRVDPGDDFGRTVLRA